MPRCQARGRRSLLQELGNPLAAINFIGTLLERERKAPEGGVEHRSNKYREGAASEFVLNKKTDVAGILAERMKSPSILACA